MAGNLGKSQTVEPLLPLPKPEWKVFGAPRPISFTFVKQNFNKKSQEFRRRPLYLESPQANSRLG